MLHRKKYTVYQNRGEEVGTGISEVASSEK